MDDINLTNLVSDLSDDIHKEHKDLSLSVVKDIIETTVKSERVEDYFNCLKEERDSSTLMNLIASLDGSLEDLEERLIDVQRLLQEAREEVTPVLTSNNRIVATFKASNKDKNDNDINKLFDGIDTTRQEEVILTTGQFNPLWSVKSVNPDDFCNFVYKMQQSIRKEFGIYGDSIRDGNKLVQGTYIDCTDKYNIYYTKIIDKEEYIKNKLLGFKDHGFMPLLAFYYMRHLRNGKYTPNSRTDNSKYDIIQNDQKDKFDNILINNINSFLLQNCDTKVTKENINGFIAFIYETFIDTDEMQKRINDYSV